MKEPVPAVCGRFHQAIELIGGRWTGAIIQILLRGPSRYATIRAAIPDISDRMLSERLRVLESEGLVSRRVVPETPVRVEYSLAEKGRTLEQALQAIASWAERWIPLPSGARQEPTPADVPRLVYTGKPRIKPKISV